MTNRAQRRAAQAMARKSTPTGGDIAKRSAKIGRLLSELAQKKTEYAESQDELARIDRELTESRAIHAAKIEEFLDELAALANLMTDKDNPAFKVAGDLLEKHFGEARATFVRMAWHGATAETIDKLVANEVIRRASLRGDIGMALSVMDRIAIVADAARQRGDDVTEAAHASFANTLGAANGAGTRTRLIASKWRDVTAGTLEDIVVNAVLDNLDESVRVAKQFGVLSEFTDDDAEDGFRRRLDIEYKLTRDLLELDVLMEGMIDRAARDNLERYGDAVRTMSDDELREAAKNTTITGEWSEVRAKILKIGWRQATAETIDAMMLETAFRKMRDLARGPEPESPTEQAASLSTPGPNVKEVTPSGGIRLYAPTFDRTLMRHGARIWKETYAKGLEPSKIVIEIGSDPYLNQEMAKFAVMWAVHAFQRITTSHTYAAAMMCTDADAESLASIHEQWSAFLVIVPNGLLKAADKYEFRRILVTTVTNYAELTIVDFSNPGEEIMLTISDHASTLPELLSRSDDYALEHDIRDRHNTRVSPHKSEISRAFTMARRLVAGLLLSMQNADAVRTREVERKAGRPGKREEEEPAHRIVIVGQPITVDCRDGVRHYIERGRGKSGGGGGLPQVQWMVRGHWRRQVYGVGRLGRKTIWIKPHWAGKVGAPILSRARKVSPKDGEGR
jgi:hypothetical protein